MTYCFRVKTEDKIFNTIVITPYGYCELLEKVNNDLNACYVQWEIIKEWRLK